MAKAKAAPALTPAERKAAKADLKTQLATINTEHAKYVSDVIADFYSGR
ncbi:hypothetical protein QTI66_32620 [Variovorax sp. J22R133]|nr:hypothetical protein [Variovorax sp. J22R133]MDM0116872.1 hypothetical protein [Variovorax sp. J22R133]